MKVKICGIRDLETALYAKQIGTDAIGFVFAKSKRQLSAEQAEEMAAGLGKDLLKVGVFVNEELEKIESIASQASLDVIQLHGDEPPEFAEKLRLPVIKAFSFEKGAKLSDILSYPADFILLDSPAGPYRGGNGTSFDWKLLEKESFDRSRLILAGGLNKENVKEAIRTVRPFAVDVSSGVETDGKKDQEKMNQFIQTVKGVTKNDYICTTR
ncbi:phosphoribosylanthranilate isomerase [Pseudobacillus wudalianchiensis]|uniref:N-(5'-phosphoribosyl)anthranilate isomerase n=1 Tax=Pseudobacillus wudalianchiensis TaxID=1743143 RepID=A0A1B9ADR3_9BACI|nr:phosphoribosylanthranilate isomerase [Bacillus wudalianchiensis]OCA81972.1 N-(5'-phosphoribosyl)anthranilate isomerase [Bacillus wudalianchiensis]